MSEEEKEIYISGHESYAGDVPIWLAIVYGSLIVWGVYYLIKYWGGFEQPG